MDAIPSKSHVTRRDVELSLTIREALMKDERLSSDSVGVTVVGGVATLLGTVQSHRRKAIAIDTAESIRGCREVIDEIEVRPPGILDDEVVANNVRAALESSADVTKEVITVSVKSGVVTLEGHVATTWERAVAGDIALGARGVRDVRNMILVDLPRKIDDTVLTTSIHDAMIRSSALQNTSIRVAVSDGAVVLSGTVSEPWQRRRAQRVAERFPVTSVRNEIKISEA